MSTIEWTDITVNPIRARNTATGRTGWHCEHVSEGCRNCYAEKLNLNPLFGKPFAGTRLAYLPTNLEIGPWTGGGKPLVEVFLDEGVLAKVLAMRKDKPKRVFWCSMTDLYGHWVTDAMLDRIKAVQAMTPHLTHIELTKRPERARAYLSDLCADGGPMAQGRPAEMLDRWEAARKPMYRQFAKSGKAGMQQKVGMMPEFGPKWPLPNVHLGVSVSNQDDADKFVPILLETPAAYRIVSFEPALGAVDFRSLCNGHYFIDALKGEKYYDEPGSDGRFHTAATDGRIDQIIMGGESGTGDGLRPMHPDWARGVRDDCVGADVAFFFKQWGAWIPYEEKGGLYMPADGGCSVVEGHDLFHDNPGKEWNVADTYCVYRKVGKNVAGRVLDGRTWDEMPKGEGV